MDTISPALLLPGAVVQVYSRQLRVIDYADRFTRSRLQARRERCVCATTKLCSLHCLVKPLVHDISNPSQLQDSSHDQTRCCATLWRDPDRNL